MIFDKISNIDKYSFSQDIICFVKNINSDISLGRHQINKTDFANVETYLTKSHENCYFEAHKKFIDIQILLSGNERIDFTSKNLQVREDYNADRDIVFFENPEYQTNTVCLENGYFAVFEPGEAHKPQMNFEKYPAEVKKVVVKICVE